MIKLVVQDGEGGRIDRLLRDRYPRAPRREIDKLIGEGVVSRHGRPLKKGTRIEVGDEIELERAPPRIEDLRPAPEAASLEVLVSTDDFVAVNKPAGISTHPLWAYELGTLANRVAARFPACIHASDEPREGGAVHRLDRGTSGLVVFARTHASYRQWRQAFSTHRFQKTYLALTRSRPTKNPIDVALIQRGERAVPNDSGLPCQTRWVELGRSHEYTLLRCSTRHGRMHQIRAHLAHAGAAIVGDSLYGGSAAPATLIDFFLHAESLVLDDSDLPRLLAPLTDDRVDTLAHAGLVHPPAFPE